MAAFSVRGKVFPAKSTRRTGSQRTDALTRRLVCEMCDRRIVHIMPDRAGCPNRDRMDHAAVNKQRLRPETRIHLLITVAMMLALLVVCAAIVTGRFRF